MIRVLIILVLIIQSTTSLIAQDLSLYEKKVFTSPSGQQLPYRILFPENYDQSKKYPLVLFLHGGGERGDDNEKQLTHGAKLFLIEENRKNFQAIVIVPQCPMDSYWAAAVIDRTTTPFTITVDYSKPEPVALQSAVALVKKISKEEGVDKKRIYITGISMGGMGTYEAIYRYPKLFAAAMPICGAGDVNRYDQRVAKVPFRVFHGAVDAVVDVKNSQQMVEKLKVLKASVGYTKYPNVNHNSWDNAFAEPDFLSWMFSKKR